MCICNTVSLHNSLSAFRTNPRCKCDKTEQESKQNWQVLSGASGPTHRQNGDGVASVDSSSRSGGERGKAFTPIKQTVLSPHLRRRTIDEPHINYRKLQN